MRLRFIRTLRPVNPVPATDRSAQAASCRGHIPHNRDRLSGRGRAGSLVRERGARLIGECRACASTDSATWACTGCREPGSVKVDSSPVVNLTTPALKTQLLAGSTKHLSGTAPDPYFAADSGYCVVKHGSFTALADCSTASAEHMSTELCLVQPRCFLWLSALTNALAAQQSTAPRRQIYSVFRRLGSPVYGFSSPLANARPKVSRLPCFSNH